MVDEDEAKAVDMEMVDVVIVMVIYSTYSCESNCLSLTDTFTLFVSLDQGCARQSIFLRRGQGRARVKICIIAATKGFRATLDLVVVHLLIGQIESLRR